MFANPFQSTLEMRGRHPRRVASHKRPIMQILKVIIVARPVFRDGRWHWCRWLGWTLVRRDVLGLKLCETLLLFLLTDFHFA